MEPLESRKRSGPDRGPVELLAELFSSEGAKEYLGEPVTQAEHQLQSAALARAAGAPDTLVAAALLHDVGHFMGVLSGNDLMAGTDNHHEYTGARFLRRHFGDAVSEPVRLHVAAKRYLCAVDAGYFARLSDASRFTLSVQGGPFDPDEVAAFEREPAWRTAIELRRFDEEAKVPALAVPPFEDYVELLESLVVPEA